MSADTALRGRRILVTGASGGIGSAVVRKLVRRGASVIASALPGEALDRIVEESGASALPMDLTSEQDIARALRDLDVWGVVNCAGWGGVVASPEHTTTDDFDQVIAVNARGAFLVIKHAGQNMVRAGRGGSIVNISSQASLIALHGHLAYAASKAALDSITRVCALELGPHGIRVNSVNPTVVMTPMSASYWGRSDIGEPYLSRMPLHRWATEEDIAGPIAFLLSDDAAMITGVCLPVDGGYTAQ